jgi:hypothetical protein
VDSIFIKGLLADLSYDMLACMLARLLLILKGGDTLYPTVNNRDNNCVIIKTGKNVTSFDVCEKCNECKTWTLYGLCWMSAPYQNRFTEVQIFQNTRANWRDWWEFMVNSL